MNATIASTLISANRGSNVEIVLVNGDSVYGTALSVNSKGVNVKDDEGKTRSVSLARIDHIDVLADDDTFGADDDADDLAAADLADEDTEADMIADELAQQLSDGMSTAELAAILSDSLDIALTPKELRVHLRALGMGVGKGRKYSLTPSAYDKVRVLVVADAPN